MRIPLRMVEDGIILSARILAPHTTGHLFFIVDTGSGTSFIGGIDTERLKIPLKGFAEKDKVFWGDKEFRMSKLKDVRLWVKGEDKGKEVLKTFDLDFLRKQNLMLVVDGKKNTAYFEEAK